MTKLPSDKARARACRYLRRRPRVPGACPDMLAQACDIPHNRLCLPSLPSADAQLAPLLPAKRKQLLRSGPLLLLLVLPLLNMRNCGGSRSLRIPWLDGWQAIPDWVLHALRLLPVLLR